MLDHVDPNAMLTPEAIDRALDAFFPQGWRSSDPHGDEWLRVSMREAAAALVADLIEQVALTEETRPLFPVLTRKARVELEFLSSRGHSPFGVALRGREGFAVVGACGEVLIATSPAPGPLDGAMELGPLEPIIDTESIA